MRPHGATGSDGPFRLDLELAEAAVDFDRAAARRRWNTSATGVGRMGRLTESSARPDL
jgi:hypothetical protein